MMQSPETSQHVNTSQAGATAPDLLDHLRTGAKSLSETGQHLLKQLAKQSASRLNESPDKNSVIDMNANTQALNKTANTPATANQLIRQQLPGLTRQLLGKRFNTVNKIASLVMPEGSFDKASDQVLELLADFSSLVSNAEHVLDEAGVESLASLQGDTERSGRLAKALAEKNRYLAIAQGAISGATGVVGAASDIPLSMILALRTVYLTGRAYGFELDKAEDRALVYEALSNADLSLITEKQAILLALRTLSTALESGNIQSLQSLVGSTNDIEPLLKLLSDSNGQLKWKISPSLISKISPAIGGVVGALYNARLLKGVSDSANQIFTHARQHALGQGTEHQQTLSIEDKVINPQTPDSKEEQAAQQEAQQAILENADIAKVEVVSRKEHEQAELSDEAQDEKIHDQLSALADQLVTPAESDSKNTTSDNVQTASNDDAEQKADTDTQEKDTADKSTTKSRTRKTKAADATTTEDGATATTAKADTDKQPTQTQPADDSADKESGKADTSPKVNATASNAANK